MHYVYIIYIETYICKIPTLMTYKNGKNLKKKKKNGKNFNV